MKSMFLQVNTIYYIYIYLYTIFQSFCLDITPQSLRALPHLGPGVGPGVAAQPAAVGRDLDAVRT